VINYGFPAHSDEEYLRAVCQRVRRTRISALLLPGIGTVDDLRMAADCGVQCIRVATHCTEADVSRQHIGLARKLGLDTVGFLMMAHRSALEQLVEQALRMDSYGATTVYVTDSAGYMLPDDVTDRVARLRGRLAPETEVGFHGHHNLAMGVANSLAALHAGANRIDGSCAGRGAGSRAAFAPVPVWSTAGGRANLAGHVCAWGSRVRGCDGKVAQTRPWGSGMEAAQAGGMP
jgi:4-hydroxy-2-oxovalerate/4-hydroxy-2-oxohexanoate aldolase